MGRRRSRRCFSGHLVQVVQLVQSPGESRINTPYLLHIPTSIITCIIVKYKRSQCLFGTGRDVTLMLHVKQWSVPVSLRHRAQYIITSIYVVRQLAHMNGVREVEMWVSREEGDDPDTPKSLYSYKFRTWTGGVWLRVTVCAYVSDAKSHQTKQIRLWRLKAQREIWNMNTI